MSTVATKECPCRESEKVRQEGGREGGEAARVFFFGEGRQKKGNDNKKETKHLQLENELPKICYEFRLLIMLCITADMLV